MTQLGVGKVKSGGERELIGEGDQIVAWLLGDLVRVGWLIRLCGDCVRDVSDAQVLSVMGNKRWFASGSKAPGL